MGQRQVPDADILPYVIVQVIGAIVAVLYVIASGTAGFDPAGEAHGRRPVPQA